jgi:site-specific recombinase XerD
VTNAAKKGPTLDSLVDAYLADQGAGDDQRAAVLEGFAAVVAPKTPRLLARRDVERWLAGGAGLADLETLRAFFSWLLAEGYIGRDPCANVRVPNDSLVYGFRPTHGAPKSLTEALVLRGLAPKTIRLYCRIIRDAAGWCEDRGEILANVTPGTIAAYSASRPRTHSSQQLIRAALKHYWEIKGRKNPPLRAIRVPPKPRMVCRALDDDEARTLAEAARARGDLPGLAVLLGLYQALRREEIATLRWDAFDGEGWMTVTPHRLRHTSLATACDNTGDLRSVQAFARHSRPEITSGYTRATTARLMAVVNSIDY